MMDAKQVLDALLILTSRRLPSNIDDFSPGEPETLQLCVTKSAWGVNWETYSYHIQGCNQDGEVYYVSDVHPDPGQAVEEAEIAADRLLREEG